MFELTLRSAPSRRPSVDVRACLRFEALEERVVANAAPSITSFYVSQYLPNRAVVVSGTVSDDCPQGVTVNFSGVACGTARPDSTGHFSANLTCSSLGNIQAVAVDPQSPPSAPAQATVSNAAPQIQDFTASQGTGNMWTFSGKVVDEAAQGLTVVLTSGMPDLLSKYVTVAADGTFSVTVALSNPLDHGTVGAACTDWWGAQSDDAYALVQPV